MDTDIEGKIRSRIEAVLLNDARNYDEMKLMATSEDPLDNDPFTEERNLYQRIINSYRNAVSEVNGLLEENIGFLSSICRIAETIKDKNNFREICSQTVSCILQDLRAEYCSVVFRKTGQPESAPQYLEGIREQRRFLCSHSRPSLLGSQEFDQVVANLAEEASDCLNIGDVYREPRFNTVDFPSVVRSLACVPIRLGQTTLGALILSHSLPHFFAQNHLRVLKILASSLAHFWLLTEGSGRGVEPAPLPPAQQSEESNEEILSIVLLNFEMENPTSCLLADRDVIRNIRAHLSRTLGGKETILLYDDTELLVLLPEIAAEQLPTRVGSLHQAFEAWKKGQREKARGLYMQIGYSTCESGEDLTHTLEAASLIMRSHREDECELIPEEPNSAPLQ